MNLPLELEDERRKFTLSLSEEIIYLEDIGDKLFLEPNVKCGEVMAKMTYLILVEQRGIVVPQWWFLGFVEKEYSFEN